MQPAVVVFDFDGTLVDSNDIKRESFFDLCPDYGLNAVTVTEVLGEMGEVSRYDIFREILKRSGDPQETLEDRVSELTRIYGRLVAKAVGLCAERPHASRALSVLAGQYRLYVSSMTPRDQLERLISQRGWSRYFEGIYGYPSRKPETLKEIMSREGCDASRVLVVGDGESDCNAAAETGCSFYPACSPDALLKLLEALDCV